MKDTPETPQPAILAFGTAVPPYLVDQYAVSDWIIESLGRPAGRSRWITRLYHNSDIKTRYSCLPDADYPPAQSRWGPGRTLEDAPTTAERMHVYEREAPCVGIQAAQRALAEYSTAIGSTLDEATSTITHLIAVSCTGFFAPGLDQVIARQLGLPITVQRTIIGFMGCAAAFNALRAATQIVQAQPHARVLIVCVELCTIHIQPGVRPVNLIVASLFADGAGACIVGMPQAAPETSGDCFTIQSFHTELSPETESFMVWKIGDHGFTLELSNQIPQCLADVAPRGLARLLPAAAPAPAFWAIHPGGRAIVDRLAELFALTAAEVEPSRAVLRDYGNLSSPTILFVLDAHRKRLRQQTRTPCDGVAMAFGPGLVTEMAHVRYVPPALA